MSFITVSVDTEIFEEVMLKRIITGACLFCIFVPTVIFSDTVVFPVFLAFCIALGIFEILRCVGLQCRLFLTLPLMAIGVFSPFALRYFGFVSFVDWLTVILLFALLYIYGISVFSKGSISIQDASVVFMLFVYLTVGFNALLYLCDQKNGGVFVFLMAFIGAWITDIFAYFCGMLFGKHKLIPDVSPKKTVEGAIGGILFCVAFMVLYAFIVNSLTDYKANYLIFVLAGLLASVVSMIGDLSMSLIKRHYGIKDYGKIFPGHGGILDRFDSVLAVSVAIFTLSFFFEFFEVL